MLKRLNSYLNSTKFIDILVWLIFLLTFLTFVCSPFTFDMFALYGGAHQADYIDGNWLYRAFNVWDLKGVYYRVFLFFIYKITTQFVAFASSYAYVTMTKFVFSLFTIISMFASCAIGKNTFSLQKIYKPALLLSSSVFACFIQVHMQAEMVCIIKMIFAFALFMNLQKNPKFPFIKLFVAGAVLGTIFFYKSIDILLVFSFIAGICLYKNIQNQKVKFSELIYGALGVVFSLCVGFVLILLLNKSELINMLNAGIYQKTLFSSAYKISVFEIMYRFFKDFILYSMGIPVLFIGIIAGLKNLSLDITNRNYYNIACRIVLWSVSAAIVIVPNRYFGYHYFIFVFAALLEVYLLYINEDFRKEYNKIWENKIHIALNTVLGCYLLVKLINYPYGESNAFILGASVFFLALFVSFFTDIKRLKLVINYKSALVFICIVYISYLSILSDNFKSQVLRQKYQIEYNKIQLLKLDITREECLYLEGGTGSYFWGNKSYLAEFYPLPLQRITENSKYKLLETRQIALKRALTYHGRYIMVADSWFFGKHNHKNKAIKDKLAKEYVLVGKYIGQAVPSCYILKKQTKFPMEYVCIYKRK